ncbi:MAG: hypothetical protein IKU10_00085 [Clostridia bacterium]|nr:hypothetical protein [Clostridia bacterium]
MKRIITCLLLVTLVFAAFVLPASAQTEPTLMVGDTDFDEKISAADAIAILKIAVRKIDYFPPEENATQEQWLKYYYWQTQKVIGDVNNDGATTAEDALWILKYVVGKVKEFPVTDVTQLVRYNQLPAWPL